MASQTRTAKRRQRLAAGAAACAGLAASIVVGALPASADPTEPATPTSPTQTAGTQGLELTGGAAGGTPTLLPGRQSAAQAAPYTYVLDQLSQEFTRGSSAGQVANLLNEALTLRAQGFAPKPADLMAVQAALSKRPNQGPLISALQGTVSHQHQLQSQMGASSSQNQPQVGFGINQNTWAPGNPMIQDDPIFPMPGRS